MRGASLILALVLCGTGARAQETVGRIEGQAFTASGQVRVEQGAERSTTTLLSGSTVVVHEGYARLYLTDGSELDVCGPAKISLLQSGGALTLALESGRVHGRLAPTLPITVYTPLATATPVTFDSAQRDVVVGLDPRGNLCLHAALGAVRLEHQFTGERVLAPQAAELSLAGNGFDSLVASPDMCRCDPPPDPVLVGVREPPRKAPETKVAEQRAPEPPVVQATSVPSAERTGATGQRTEPRVIAVMPPLTFDAKNPELPAPTRPEVALIMREVRVEPAAVFSGRVAPRAQASIVPAAARETAKVEGDANEKKPGFGTRLKNFFARLFGRRPTT